MQLLAVAACVRILSTTVAGLPFDAVRMRGELRETLEPPPGIISDPFGGAADTAMLTRRAGFTQMMVSLLLRGNAYAAITVTPPPTSSMMPRFSWPNTMPGSAAVLPSYMCRSDPQMQAEVIRTMTSLGCSIRGSGTSSTATSKGFR